MKQTKRVTNRSRRIRRQGNSNDRTVGRAYVGTLTNPPKSTGTVQVPRPLQVRVSAFKMSFRNTIVATTGTSLFYYASISLYAPFQYARTLGSGLYSLTSAVPTNLTNIMNSFALYKIRKIQLIFEPVVATSTSSYPYIIGMDPDHVITNQPTEQGIMGLANSTTLDVRYPDSITYLVPKPSFVANAVDNFYQGGWMLTNNSTLSRTGGINIGMPVAVAATTYSRIEVVYEIWFKTLQQ